MKSLLLLYLLAALLSGCAELTGYDKSEDRHEWTYVQTNEGPATSNQSERRGNDQTRTDTRINDGGAQ
jgi:uncharacterized protein YceK